LIDATHKRINLISTGVVSAVYNETEIQKTVPRKTLVTHDLCAMGKKIGAIGTIWNEHCKKFGFDLNTHLGYINNVSCILHCRWFSD
jgi:hypothetical protein